VDDFSNAEKTKEDRNCDIQMLTAFRNPHYESLLKEVMKHFDMFCITSDTRHQNHP